MTHNQNGSRPYTIAEIKATLMPPAGQSKWFALYREIILRLEQTPPRSALHIVLADGDGGQGAVGAISRLAADRIGKGHVSLSWATEDGHTVLYARRGPNWSKT